MPIQAQPSDTPIRSALLPTYARAGVTFVRGEGAWLIAENGDRYLDFGAGIAVNALGHAHPHLVEALISQAKKLWHTSNLFPIPEGERLARRFVDETFADRVFFTNSGAEAIEAAIKIARKYHFTNGEPNRYRILTFEGAFHGRTLATIAAGGQQKYLKGFGPKVDGFDQIAFADHEALDRAIGPDTGAILIEPIQGEGGIRVVPSVCLRGLRQLCDERGLLLIFDEIQTGVGRTGALFAHQREEVTPDIMAIAKGMGGGFPVGACLATEKAARGMTVGAHGSTFGGNPLAMAVGNAVLDIILAEGFLRRVDQAALLLKQRLAEVADHFPDVIEELRGVGLMLGLKLRMLPADFAALLRAQKLIAVPAGDNVLRLLPPLIISDEEIREAVNRIEEACDAARQSKSVEVAV